MLLLLKQVIEKAGSDNKEKIIDAILVQSVIVGNGKVTMNPDHHMTMDILIAEVMGRQLKVKEYIGEILQSDQCKGKKM